LPVKLTAAEQAALNTLDGQATVQAQGTLREIVADSYFQRNGYKALDGKCGSGNCFDGVYVKDGKVYINEVKPLNSDGTIKLSGPSRDLATQMTDAWIDGALQRLEKGTAEQKALVSQIRKADMDGKLVKLLTGVNQVGMSILKLN